MNVQNIADYQTGQPQALLQQKLKRYAEEFMNDRAYKKL